jgi:hypothetical protein
MKHGRVYILLLLAGIASSCNKNVYSEQLKKEEKLIESFIARQGIQVVDTEPTSMEEWGDNVYWRVPDYDNFYFHMTTLGDTLPSAKEAEIESGETVLLRFKRYTLEEYSDTIYNWTTMDSSDPIKFEYLVNSEKACTGWQVALKYMRYTDSQCKIICPSKMGFSDENSSVTPYGYDLKIKIKRY